MNISHVALGPGQTCPVCTRRLPYPKKESSPVSTTKSFRLPSDVAENFTENLSQAALTVGVTSAHKYPVYTFLDWLIDVILSDPDRWQGAFHYGGEGNEAWADTTTEVPTEETP